VTNSESILLTEYSWLPLQSCKELFIIFRCWKTYTLHWVQPSC